MSSNKDKNKDYESLVSSKEKINKEKKDYDSIKISKKNKSKGIKESLFSPKSVSNKVIGESKIEKAENTATEKVNKVLPSDTFQDISYEEKNKLEKRDKERKKNKDLLSSDNWLDRNGHTLTFAGLFLFTFFVFFRPYETIPGLGFLTSGAFFLAVITLLIYIPTQFSAEGSLTIMTTEVKCVLVLVVLAIVTILIARDKPLAWETFNDTFIKAVLMFIIMVNVIRTKRRLMSILWLSTAIGIYASCWALYLYITGEFNTEGYRVSIDLKGMLENPNEMAIHLVIMMPITLCLALGSQNKILKTGFYLTTALLSLATIVTFSRGGFLGLICVGLVLAWKLGRKQRLKVSLISLISAILFIILAPGNYGLRILSIFLPGLDPVGSADQRKENLILSIIATIRNPWGIGIGNSVTFGVHNLQTHNAFTQVSSELGVLGVLAYLIFLISPFRKLGAIERVLFEKNKLNWFYYLSIGLQAAIVGYMVTAFFASVAYHWYGFYLIAYAVAFRRIYIIENGLDEEDVKADSLTDNFWGWQVKSA